MLQVRILEGGEGQELVRGLGGLIWFGFLVDA